MSRPGAERWYAGVCGSASPTDRTIGGRPLAPALLETVCREYWEERGPLVHVLDRLVYERIPAPGGSMRREAVVFWPDGGDQVNLGPRVSLFVLEPADLADAARLTPIVAGARLLVGPWSPRLLLGPMLGVPTLALTDASSASPHLDLAHRAARTLASPLLLVDRSQLDLATRLARRVAA